jgi:hypothetical protein
MINIEHQKETHATAILYIVPCWLMHFLPPTQNSKGKGLMIGPPSTVAYWCGHSSIHALLLVQSEVCLQAYINHTYQISEANTRQLSVLQHPPNVLKPSSKAPIRVFVIESFEYQSDTPVDILCSPLHLVRKQAFMGRRQIFLHCHDSKVKK